MTEIELLQTSDAAVWAEEFLNRFAVSAIREDCSAEDPFGLMVGWFANAMAAAEVTSG